MFDWISKLWKNELEIIDFSILKTDMHSHLIPGIDDGVNTIEESLKIILKLKELGFTKIITTPHTMSDVYNNSPQTIRTECEKIHRTLRELQYDISLEFASEYYVDFEFQRKIDQQEFLVFGDNFLLIEFPFIDKPHNIDNIIFNLQLQGYNVVLAHPERYLYYSMKDYKNLTNKGVFLQLNLLSILGYYSKEVKIKAEKLIRDNMISFVGTDCHNIRQAELLKDCFTNPLWHQLSQSGKLLNQGL